MSIYDDVNNNRLNLHNNNAHINAYEERNIYVANNALSDSANKTNDSFKSYIHIEVYKGKLDESSTTKPRNMTSVLKIKNLPQQKPSAFSTQFRSNKTYEAMQMAVTKP